MLRFCDHHRTDRFSILCSPFQGLRGTDIMAETSADHSHAAHESSAGRSRELVLALLCGSFLLVGWLVSFASWPPWSAQLLLIIAFALGALPTLRETLARIRAGRFEIDVLMLAAAAGAALLGEWAEGTLLLFLFSLGHALEHFAMGRARQAIRSLADLAPRTALVRRDGESVEVPVEQVQPGEIVIVRPHERIPADGFVISGESSVNQAPVTGESVPADKIPVPDRAAAAARPDRIPAVHRVFAGTLNDSGVLELEVTRPAADNTLARVIRLVSEAAERTSPTQQFTSSFERRFVPAVLLFVGLLLLVPLVSEEPFGRSFYRAMAVLVAASPCALAIATPSAVLSGVARAARGGVLVKGGGPLETLGRVTAVAFDKTGTLTEGRPELTDVVPAAGSTETELLRIAVAVERLSDHPLAAAVVRGGQQRLAASDIPDASSLESLTGRGLRATVDGRSVVIGKTVLFSEIGGATLPEELRQISDRLERTGRTTVVVRADERYLGVLGLMDTPRKTAAPAIRRLRELGIRKMTMLSGDNQRVVDAVAAEVGLDEARGDLMPEDKVALVRQLHDQGGVAMVGDGVNDAPAMTAASVGIAMGAAGSDVALETADVALMADNLDSLVLAVGLSRRTGRIIRQNLWISLGMVAVLIPATLSGLQMGPAVVLHEGSTLIVVFNALRLLKYTPPIHSSQSAVSPAAAAGSANSRPAV